MIILKGVYKSFDHLPVINNLSLKIARGEKCCLVGPIGSGKTTLLRLIAGLECPDNGEIFIDNNLVSSKDFLLHPNKRNIGMVFQNLALWPHLNVLKHLTVVMNSRLTRSEKKNLAISILEQIGLKQFSKKRPAELSGGQKQKLAIARMMSTSPRIALLDEPFSNLDNKSREEVKSLLFKWINKNNITCIMVMHYISDKDLSLFDTLLTMKNGRINITNLENNEKVEK